MSTFPLKQYSLPHAQGVFGAIRKHDIHTGIDLYCAEGDEVRSIEDGTVLNVVPFTGEQAGSPWWNDTHAVLIKGSSGVFLYGEITSNVSAGDRIQEGALVGTVKTVLKRDKGLPMTMLHLELYDHSYCGDGVVWELGTEIPEGLADPSYILETGKEHVY